MERLKWYMDDPPGWCELLRATPARPSLFDQSRSFQNDVFIKLALRRERSRPEDETGLLVGRFEHRVAPIQIRVRRREIAAGVRAAGLFAGDRAAGDEPGEGVRVAQQWGECR